GPLHFAVGMGNRRQRRSRRHARNAHVRRPGRRCHQDPPPGAAVAQDPGGANSPGTGRDHRRGGAGAEHGRAACAGDRRHPARPHDAARPQHCPGRRCARRRDRLGGRPNGGSARRARGFCPRTAAAAAWRHQPELTLSHDAPGRRAGANTTRRHPMKTRLPRHTLIAAALTGLVAAGAVQAASDTDVIRIGFITDMSGPYADTDGPGGLEAIRMAVQDAGGSVLGKKIEILSADHQNKPEIASARAREWIDQQGLSMLIGGVNAAAGLAMNGIIKEKHVPYINIGAATARLTNEDCTPYTVHYEYDTVALAKGTGSAVIKQGGKSWYFLVADYAFGHSLEADTS